jgi:hypothetical protein
MKLLQALAIGAAVLVSACARPKLTGLDVTSGPPHTLVMVEGADLDGANVLWDNNPIPSGFLGAHMFSVPPGATPGLHAVSLRNSHGDSNIIVKFNVQAPAVVPFPAPRIDAVTLVGANFDTPGHVTAGLYVQGANIDVGAVVLIGGVEVATYSHKGLRNEWFGVLPKEFDYPIGHFVSTVALTGARTVGETLAISVRNLDGHVSAAVPYILPASQATMDSDGDGLPDSWETNSTDPVVASLPAPGVTPYRRDILVELDAMAAPTATQPGLQHPLAAATLDAARAMFKAAPILNPMGPPGINLILDTSETLPYVPFVCFDVGTASGCADNPSLGIAKFSTLKANHFRNSERDKFFHYGIWGAQGSDEPGRSDHADDFVLIFDDWGTAMSSDHPVFRQSVRTQVEELTHELGHDLGLHHGGGDDDDHPYKPNHWSVMSYTWDTRSGFDNPFRVAHVTCPAFYYQKAGSTESATGETPENAGTAVDYSSGMGKKLAPRAGGASVVVCGKPVDWDGDGNTERITDAADWPALVFDGPAGNGGLTP